MQATANARTPWLPWLGVSCISLIPAFIAALFVEGMSHSIIPSRLDVPTLLRFGLIFEILAYLVAGASGGVVLGALQYALLRLPILHFRRWVLLSAIGGAIGWCIMREGLSLSARYLAPSSSIVASELGFNLLFLLIGGSGGLIMGSLQWLALRQRLVYAERWMILMLFSGIAFTMALLGVAYLFASGGSIGD